MKRPATPEEKESRLRGLAVAAMKARGLRTAPSPAAKLACELLPGPASSRPGEKLDELRELPWCSIDNEQSKDLDQLSAALPLKNGGARLLVALADVDALVGRSSPIDEDAAWNTTSVYTPAKIFPMIPERLSTDLSSLNCGEDRLAIVIGFDVAPDGEISNESVTRAIVRNKAKLAYGSTGAWLEGRGPMPEPVAKVPGLDENIRLQNALASELRRRRHENGALDLESPEPKPAVENGRIAYHGAERGNLAKLLIEDLMIAANGAGARFLASKGMPSIRRVVRTPKRWNRIVELAGGRGFALPLEPDPKALERFLDEAKKAGRAAFQEISFSVMKLLGPGEYALEKPGAEPPGHFGLAVKDYAHSTAPNRRFADLLTHRLFKAAMTGKPSPYSLEELESLARRCTSMEDAAKKVERQMNKSAVAMMLEDRVGEEFDALVTGRSDKGVWARIAHPPVEGRIVAGFDDLDVGDACVLRLVNADAVLGHIDFKRIRA